MQDFPFMLLFMGVGFLFIGIAMIRLPGAFSHLEFLPIMKTRAYRLFMGRVFYILSIVWICLLLAVYLMGRWSA